MVVTRQPDRRAPGADHSVARVRAFAACGEILELLRPSDRDVVVRRLAAYYCVPGASPPPRPPGEAR